MQPLGKLVLHHINTEPEENRGQRGGMLLRMEEITLFFMSHLEGCCWMDAYFGLLPALTLVAT